MSGSSTYQFGAFGRLIKSLKPQQINWDAYGNPASHVDLDGAKSQYWYLPEDKQRFRIKDYDATGELLADRIHMNQYFTIDLIGGKAIEYFYAGDKRFAEKSDGIVRYVVKDYLSSENFVFDSTGTLETASVYRPYGGYLGCYKSNSCIDHDGTDSSRFSLQDDKW